MPARLTVQQPDRPARSLLAEEDAAYVIGRDAGCDLVLEDERISRRHARLEFTAGGWRLVDLESKNGSGVDGRPAGEAPLPDRCWVSFGGLVGRFERLSEEAAHWTTQRRQRRWQTSLELRRTLSPALAVPELLERLLTSVVAVSSAHRALALVDRGDGGLAIEASVGLSPEELAAGEFRGSVGAIERALSTRSVVATSDAWSEDFLAARPSVVAAGIRALVVLPLEAADRLLGVVYADSREAGTTFDELDVEILEGLTSQAALALALARIDRELVELAAALPDRRGLDGATAAALGAELRALRPGAAAAPLEDALPAVAPRWEALVAHHHDTLGEQR